jgi:hypothetical protein
MSACETLPNGLPHDLDRYASTDRHWRGRLRATSVAPQEMLGGPNDDSMESFWITSLSNYTACQLTNQSDKTVAVWSIAKVLRDILDENYGGGLWERALEEQLAWRVKDIGTEARIDELQLLHPSWSWASVRAAVIPQERISVPRCYLATNHRGKSIRFRNKGAKLEATPPEARDREPKLWKHGSIAIAGFLVHGSLRAVNSGFNYVFEIATRAAIDPGNVLQDQMEGRFEIFPDEILSETDLSPNHCTLVVLAASMAYFDGTRMQQIWDDEDLLNATDDIKYSGIGLCLLPHREYKERQRRKLKTLLRLIFSRRPGLPGPAQPSGKDPIVSRVEVLLKEAKKLKRRESGAENTHFRRIGAMRFRDVGTGTWDTIQSAGRVNFWLD